MSIDSIRELRDAATHSPALRLADSERVRNDSSVASASVFWRNSAVVRLRSENFQPQEELRRAASEVGSSQALCDELICPSGVRTMVTSKLTGFLRV